MWMDLRKQRPYLNLGALRSSVFVFLNLDKSKPVIEFNKTVEASLTTGGGDVGGT